MIQNMQYTYLMVTPRGWKYTIYILSMPPFWNPMQQYWNPSFKIQKRALIALNNGPMKKKTKTDPKYFFMVLGGSVLFIFSLSATVWPQMSKVLMHESRESRVQFHAIIILNWD